MLREKNQTRDERQKNERTSILRK